MARNASKLTALGIARVDKPGRYGDGGGLYLLINRRGKKSWVYRFMLAGKAHDMGLGPYPEVSLVEARDKAFECRRMRIAGTDPLEARRKAVFDAKQAETKEITFNQCAVAYIDVHKASWRNEKHIAQWSSTIRAYADPFIGNVPVANIESSLVLKVLEPIWYSKPVTASRLRGRIEQVLDWAKSRGYRDGENPARWRGQLAHCLPIPMRFRVVRHHPALPYRQIGSFFDELRQQKGVAARALEFLILTATRTSETLGARWDETNLAEAIWTIPANRMKAQREHRIPLSKSALQILVGMEKVRQDGYIFKSFRAGRPLSTMALLQVLHRMERLDITTHGFRSTFRDWAAEETYVPGDVAEAALAHSVSNKVEAAYRRGDLFQKRRLLMDEWAAYCERPQGPAVVLEFPTRAPITQSG